MKRILSVSICLLLLFSLTIPTFAAGLTITFTADSLPKVGGTLTVDKNALMDNDSITAEMYNALLEGKTVTLKEVNDSIIECSSAPDKAENGSFSALLFAFRRKIVFPPHHGLKPTIFQYF